MWQGLQTIMDYKGKPSCELPSDASLPDGLNAFNARFEASNTEACMRELVVPDHCVITRYIADVSKTNVFISPGRPVGNKFSFTTATWPR